MIVTIPPGLLASGFRLFDNRYEIVPLGILERIANVEPRAGGSLLTFSEPIRSGVSRFLVVREKPEDIRREIDETRQRRP